MKDRIRALRPGGIRAAAELRLPPRMAQVLGQLKPEPARRFIAELAESLEMAEEANDLGPVRDVVEAWYRTVLIAADPRYNLNLAAAGRSRPRTGLSVEQVRRRYGL